jgi:PAS domain S-box-containing protein
MGSTEPSDIGQQDGNAANAETTPRDASADNEAHIAGILPHIEEGLWSWTKATGAMFLSTRWKELLGFTPETFPQTAEACRDLIHPDDLATITADLSACVAGATSSFSLEYRVRRTDGSFLWTLCRGTAIRDAAGNLLGLAGSNADITARKEAEQALRESEERFRLLTENTPDAIFLHDMHGNVLDCNPRACELLGYDPATLRTLNVADFEISCPAAVLRVFWDEMQPGPFSFEGLARRRDGTTFPTEIRGVAFPEGGRQLALVAARDLSARKEFERSLAEARDAALAANRAKTEFLASMSHEIRTPMHIILGMTELLGETAVTEAQKGYLAAIEHSGQVLLHLINDILDLSQIEANKLEIRPTAFDPAAVVDAVCTLLRLPAEKKGLRLTVRREPDVPAVVTNDPGRLRQVLMNLIWNGVKFTATGGIEVRVSGFTDAAGPGGVRIEVADTGTGIPPEASDRIFDPFTQAADSQGKRPAGTGLGLAICNRLVALMGGKITLASTPGQGSRFTFTLPSLPAAPAAAQAPEKTAPPCPAATSKPPQGPRRLLLAEDSLSNRELIRLFLDKEPYEIVMAETGREALALFTPGAFDLVLMDMEMPEMDGCAATRAIRRLEETTGSPRTPVLMLSAHAFSEYEQEGLAAGCDGFMTKPIRKSSLITALRQALDAS